MGSVMNMLTSNAGGVEASILVAATKAVVRVAAWVISEVRVLSPASVIHAARVCIYVVGLFREPREQTSEKYAWARRWEHTLIACHTLVACHLPNHTPARK